jgi:ABC-type polysaccharide transport system permease subunit
VIGGSVTVAGAIALVGPGPGILIVLAGLGILATEFAWAARVMVHTRTYAQKAADKAGIPKWAQLAMIAVGAVISIIIIIFLVSTGRI